MTNHLKDRHVLAAAVRAGAKTILTYKIKDFPHSSLTPHSITAQGPSAFLKNLYVAAPAMVMQALENQAAAIAERSIDDHPSDTLVPNQQPIP